MEKRREGADLVVGFPYRNPKILDRLSGFGIRLLQKKFFSIFFLESLTLQTLKLKRNFTRGSIAVTQ